MVSFSQRKGLVPIPSAIQIGSMDAALRNSIWNLLEICFWSRNGFMYRQNGGLGEIDRFSRAVWFSFFKQPLDSRSESAREILQEIRDFFFACEWNQVYDFVEFVLSIKDSVVPQFAEMLNRVLEKELSGYRIVANQVVAITNEQEIEMLQEAVADQKFAGVSAHLQRALELFADRKAPDYRNSIKESISAVECMARELAQDQKAMLPDALKVAERKGALHTALREGFVKLYGYTSDADGIRHALMDEPNLTAADARFFLLSCTSFVNYLKSKI